MFSRSNDCVSCWMYTVTIQLCCFPQLFEFGRLSVHCCTFPVQITWLHLTLTIFVTIVLTSGGIYLENRSSNNHYTKYKRTMLSSLNSFWNQQIPSKRLKQSVLQYFAASQGRGPQKTGTQYCALIFQKCRIIPDVSFRVSHHLFNSEGIVNAPMNSS